jgi:hypothetical protein
MGLLTVIIFIDFAGKRINFYVIKTGRAKYAGIDMPAAVTPQVKFPAIFTKADFAAITKDNGLLFFTHLAKASVICNNQLAPS